MIRTGICGAGVRWELNPESGRMTICGSGPMTNYEGPGEAPWSEYLEQIRELVVEDGVTTVGDYSFIHAKQLERFTLAPTVEVVGTYALSDCTALTEAVFPEGVRVIGAKTFSASNGLKKIHIPLSMEAIDMKAFEQNPGIEEVTYAGTMEQWLNIRISMNANGNRYLLAAYAKVEPAATWHRFYGIQEQKVPIFAIAREIIKRGGDGRFHILSIQLTTVEVPGKPGDFTLLILPDGKTLMIDSGVPFCVEKAMGAVRELDLTTLDYFMTSHPHLDHVGNALTIAKHLYGKGGGVGTYFHTGHVFKDLEPAFSAYLQEKGTTMDNHLTRGEVRQLGEVKMEVLRPTKQMLIDGVDLRGDEVNTLSLTVRFTFGKVSYLTGGDLYRADEREAVGVYGDHLKSTVLKACHHGVFTSNSDEWIETISPDVILVNSDDIGGTMLETKAKEMDIAYFSSGLDGSVLVSMTRDGEIEVKTGYGRTFTKSV